MGSSLIVQRIVEVDPVVDQKEIEASSIEQVLKTFETSKEGLTEEQVSNRLGKWGPNLIEETRKSPILKFLSYFWGPIPGMIEIAAILSAFLMDWSDFAIICTLLVINAIIGFWQEHKADNAIALLKEKLALKARVKRNGKWISISARELVPGDIIHIKFGDVVPSDIKLIEGEDVEVDQSALTGESLPVYKENGNLLYLSSIVRRGEADGIVIGTGINTLFGKTAQLVQEASRVSHYQQAVLRIGHFLIYVTIFLAALILIVAAFRNTTFLDTLKFCLILTVASIPVALPAVLSVTMAVGAENLAKQQAIVTRLVSIEELAGMDILCSDKTGTLTQNKMTIGDIVQFGDISSDEIILSAALASRVEDQDPLETPIFEHLKGGINVLKDWIVEKFQPFDPTSKRTEATLSNNFGSLKVSKGAPQAILQLCGNPPDIKEKVEKIIEEFGVKGYRSLGVARMKNNESWQCLGIISLFDPPREDSADMIQATIKLGIKVKMLTGDHLAIAREMARKLNFGQDIILAADAFPAGKHWDDDKILKADGFAQVFPEHKFNIVKSLQSRGLYVGMTGDGVNDAPALKEAHVGIAVSGATDAARGAADLVLTASGLSIIVNAVKDSRRIFHRMTSYATYRIAETIRILIFMTLSIIIFDFYPITTIMIIILALLNDGPIMMIAYDNAKFSDTPTRWNMEYVLVFGALLGLLGVFSSFLLFWIGETVLILPRDVIQTLIFLKMTVAGHLTIYLTRSYEHHFWQSPLPSKSLFWTSELTQVGGTLLAVYGVVMTPIGWGLAGFVWIYAAIWFVFNNLVKVGTFRLITHHKQTPSGKHLKRISKWLTPYNPYNVG